MNEPLLTYIELAKALGLDSGTVKNNWRSYPHIAITPSAQNKPNLRGIRFILSEVIEHCRAQTKQGTSHGYNRNAHKKGHTLPSLLQVERQAGQQGIFKQAAGQNMGGRGKEAPATGGNPWANFDVFAGR